LLLCVVLVEVTQLCVVLVVEVRPHAASEGIVTSTIITNNLFTMYVASLTNQKSGAADIVAAPKTVSTSNAITQDSMFCASCLSTPNGVS
jgi:hypothetical protein